MFHANNKEGKYGDLHYGHTKQIAWLLNVCAHLTLMAQEGENYGPVARQMGAPSDSCRIKDDGVKRGDGET